MFLTTERTHHPKVLTFVLDRTPNLRILQTLLENQAPEEVGVRQHKLPFDCREDANK